jgi:hypothetical protein
MYTVHYVVRVIIVRRPSDPLSRRATAFLVAGNLGRKNQHQ